jgi:hypothetical protein
MLGEYSAAVEITEQVVASGSAISFDIEILKILTMESEWQAIVGEIRAAQNAAVSPSHEVVYTRAVTQLKSRVSRSLAALLSPSLAEA